MQIFPAREINDRSNWLFLRFHILVFFPNMYPLLPLMEMYSVFMIVHFQHSSTKLFQTLRLSHLPQSCLPSERKRVRRALGQWTLSKPCLRFLQTRFFSNPSFNLTIRENVVLPGYEEFVLVISALYTRHAIMIKQNVTQRWLWCNPCQTMES